MHGIGVSTPRAAAVAAATMGFEGVMHTPKGVMFIKGTMEKILAAGKQSVIVMVNGGTINGVGAAPNAHFTRAPIETVGPAIFYPFSYGLRLIIVFHYYIAKPAQNDTNFLHLDKVTMDTFAAIHMALISSQGKRAGLSFP